MVEQLSLELEVGRNWGGARKGAGRKCGSPRTTGVIPHRPRNEHVMRHPLHVTLRARTDVPDLRREAVLRALHGCLRRATARGRRFVHFSLQPDHLHLLMEEGERERIARAIKGFASVTARTFNVALGRAGQLWQERYHRHDLRTPTEVHRAVGYVLHNFRKHAPSAHERQLRLLDRPEARVVTAQIRPRDSLGRPEDEAAHRASIDSELPRTFADLLGFVETALD